jgi:hypothetical protein
MSPAVLSHARRISKGDPDIEQNILACNVQNYRSAQTRGKELSIGEQVVFMQHRAGEFRSGIRNEFGSKGCKSKDVMNKKLYYQGKVEVHHIDHEVENPEGGKGAITAMTSVKNHEANYIFQIDMEIFLGALPDEERMIFVMRIEGFKQREIAEKLRWKVNAVRKTLFDIGRKFAEVFEVDNANEFGIA